MRIESGGRGSGRTYKMIEWLKENPYGILVVHNEAEAQWLRDHYDPDGIMEIGNRIVPMRAWMNRKPSFHAPQVAIDNADLIDRKSVV